MAIGSIAGAVLGGVGSALGASSSSKAAGKAANAQAQAAQINSDLQENIYNQNKNILSPFLSSGTTAGSYLNAFLGLPTTATQTGSSAGTDWAAYVNGNPDALANWNAIKNTSSGRQFGGDIAAFGQYHYGEDGSRRDLTPYGSTATTTPAVTQGQAQNAFSSFLANSDYGYQSALGGQQVSGNYSGLGSLQSGAALKALQDRQNNINTGYQSNWLGQLAGQQGIGLSAGNALAGVGTNFANAVSGNNQSAADAKSNAALIAGANNPWANALSTIGGGLLGYGK